MSLLFQLYINMMARILIVRFYFLCLLCW